MTITPPKRPRITTKEWESMAIHAFGRDLADIPLLVGGIRGYYRDSMGVKGQNDRGIYDDAIIVKSNNVFASFNANTDPSRYRIGAGKGIGKGMASLIPGLYHAHRIGIHKYGRPGQHRAIVQSAGPVSVMRDGRPPYRDEGYFGINIHRGGLRSTSSEGCQTIPPPQWEAFIALVEGEARRLWGRRWNLETIPYALIAPSTPD